MKSPDFLAALAALETRCKLFRTSHYVIAHKPGEWDNTMESNGIYFLHALGRSEDMLPASQDRPPSVLCPAIDLNVPDRAFQVSAGVL